MVKTYISKEDGLNVPLRLNNRSAIITFDKLPRDEGSIFITSNNEIQKALEAKSYFGIAYTLKEEAVEEKEEEVKAAEVSVVAYSDITRLADAKAKLVELGADASDIKKKADIIALAQKYNVAFPNLINRN